MQALSSQNPVPNLARAVGYARVSTEEQQLGLQLDALRRQGCDTVYQDLGVSGSLRDRPVLISVSPISVPAMRSSSGGWIAWGEAYSTCSRSSRRCKSAASV